jgi:hypothetical protein
MPRLRDMEVLTTEEAFNQLKVDELKGLARLLADKPPPRKDDLVRLLTRTMEDARRVRELYEGLDATNKTAIQEAVHNDEGVLREEAFAAKHRGFPNFGTQSASYSSRARPTTLALFFPSPYRHVLPSDLHDMLEEFVPEPPPVAVSAVEEPPAVASQTNYSWKAGTRVEETEEIPLRLRATAAEALHDVKAALHLVDTGAVGVSDKLRRPVPAAIKAVGAVLAGGDFYTADDADSDKYDPDSDLVIKPFAWPMIVQAAGLAEPSGGKLRLSAAGRKATTQPAAEILAAAWNKWLKNTLLDEFNRVEVIKGQKGNLTAVVPRRNAVVDVLAQCPAGKWIAIDEFFRVVKGLAHGFQVARDPWDLYLFEKQYGSFGFDGKYNWEPTQGRYVLAFLFEYAATLGLVDVAYVSPVCARADFHDRWGTDELTSLSRYDGLQYIRINPLGAWCLGVAERYQPEAVAVESLLKVLPNLDIVARDRPPPPADALFLDRFAERRSDSVWHLSRERILEAVAEGHSVTALVEFLTAKADGPLPQTAESFLEDLDRSSQLLRDCGRARLIECADTTVAQTLAHDRRLRKLCQLAGERHLVFRAADEKAFVRGLRELGYVLPRE